MAAFLTARYLAFGEFGLDEPDQRDRAAMRALQHALLLEGGQVLADRGVGDAEQLGELADPPAAPDRHDLRDAGLAARVRNARQAREMIAAYIDTDDHRPHQGLAYRTPAGSPRPGTMPPQTHKPQAA
jgi:hypothetical protein